MLAVAHDWIDENILADRAEELLLYRRCLCESSFDLYTHFRLFLDRFFFSLGSGTMTRLLIRLSIWLSVWLSIRLMLMLLKAVLLIWHVKFIYVDLSDLF